MSNRKTQLITPAILTEAVRLRRIGVYTMREIAEKLGVSREALIHAFEMQKTSAGAQEGE